MNVVRPGHVNGVVHTKVYKIICVHLRNKGTNANLLADRAEVYFMMKRIDDCIKDCEASLALDQVGHCQKVSHSEEALQRENAQGCLAAMLQRARCHMETKEWEAAVRIFERMNNRWEVEVTLKPGDLLF